MNKQQLIDGNWKVKPLGSLYFQKDWCSLSPCIPLGSTLVRAYDKAGTSPDKAIDDLGGDISNAYVHGWENHTYLRHKGNGEYSLCHEGSQVVKSGQYFCTIEEFEQRKKEREMEQNSDNNSWYDYENQKAVGMPPIGTTVLYSAPYKETAEIIVIGHHPCKPFVVWAEIIKLQPTDDAYISSDWRYCYPMDWDKLSKRKEIVDKAMRLVTQGHSAVKWMEVLYDAGMLKLPDEK